MKYEIIERNAFQVVGIKENFSCATKENDAVIPKLWGKVNNDGTIDSLAQLNNGQNKGILVSQILIKKWKTSWIIGLQQNTMVMFPMDFPAWKFPHLNGWYLRFKVQYQRQS